MRKIEVLLLTALAAFGQVPTPPAGPPADSKDYVLRSDVNMILLHATVQDSHGAFVSGLPKDSFSITEDRVKQPITFFRSDDVPVAVGLVIDNSGSMVKRRADVITGALIFIRDSRPEDEMFVVNFNDRAELGLPPEKDFGHTTNELRSALLKGEVGGQTALYDAIDLAITQFKKANLMKKVLLIVSDGADNRSKRTLKDVVRDADRAGVLIYTIGLFDENSEDKNPGVLKQLARQTGGLSYMPSDLSQLSNICSQIAKDIRNQYTIGYSSQKASLDSAFHEVKVTALDAQGKPLRVRTRTGFYGAKASAVTETERQPRPSPQ